MQIPLRISPLNTRFVAALYVAGGVGVLWGAFRARSKAEARLFVLAFNDTTNHRLCGPGRAFLCGHHSP